MSDFQANPRFRGIYTGSLPASKQDVTISDPFYIKRTGLTRDQIFHPTIWGTTGDNLNVNTDKLRHRPSDIIDHMNRARPLPSMNIS
jgi:hypothetical protein